MDYYFGDGFSDPVYWNDEPTASVLGDGDDAIPLDFSGDGAVDDLMWDSNGDGTADRVILDWESDSPSVYSDPDGSGTWSELLGGSELLEIQDSGSDSNSIENESEDPEIRRWTELPEWIESDEIGALPPDADQPPAGPLTSDDLTFSDGEVHEPPVSEPPIAEPELPGTVVENALTPEPPVQGGTEALDPESPVAPPILGADGSILVETPDGSVSLRDTDGDGALDSAD